MDESAADQWTQDELNYRALASVEGLETPSPEGEISLEEAVSRVKFLERDVELLKEAGQSQIKLNKVVLENFNVLLELYKHGTAKKEFVRCWDEA